MVNSCRNEINTEDSLFVSNYKYLPKILYKPIGEGYRLDSKVYEKVDYYGEDYLVFSDTLILNGNTTINKLAWQLIKTNNTPKILELRQISVNDKTETLSVAVFQFSSSKWQKKSLNSM